MPVTADLSFNDLVKKYLGSKLPQEMANGVPLSDLPGDTQEFINRMLNLMKRAGYETINFNLALIRWISSNIPSMLPSAWGGRIPPITLPNRHQKLDTYVSAKKYSQGDQPNLFIDLGCGFPPVTTTETAQRLPNWKIIGVDNSFADYVVYDSDGNHACFDQNGRFQYFQAFLSQSGRKLYADSAAARVHFNTLFQELSPLLPNEDHARSETVEKAGNKLVRYHIRDFEADNLTFLKSDVTDLDLPSAKVIRCMNLLIYFKLETRKKMLERIGKLLHNDGIIITGTNGLGVQSRYWIYQTGDDGVYPSEFNFSLDNLGPITFMPWFTIHENDPEADLLADMGRTIRSDRKFWPDFSQRIDELLKEHEVCERNANGFYYFYREMPPSEYMVKNAKIRKQILNEGYLDGAVDALTRKGYTAWRNTVDDIAVETSADGLFMDE